jgi:predicted ArsR family transcriptional regulator
MSDRPRTDDGRYTETVTPERVLSVFDRVDGPSITSSDVATILGCSTEAARRKLKRLHEDGTVRRRKTGRTVLWWLTSETDDESEFARQVSRKAIANQYGDDYFGKNPEWADDLSDLGENA